MTDQKRTTNVKVVGEFDTGFYSDASEWCPVFGHRNLLVCGTYQLLEDLPADENPGNSQIRLGRLFLLCAEPRGPRFELFPVQDIDMPGILDVKWSHRTIGDETWLGVVNSVGQLIFLNLNTSETDEGDTGPLLRFADRVAIAREGEASTLALSLDWSNRLEDAEPRVVVTDSKGRISIVDVATNVLTQSFDAHDYEAWIGAFNSHNTQIIYSGGDDAKLKRWDLRTDPGLGPTHVDSKSHTAGVCSLHSNPFREHIFASGSYDETVRIWDDRNLRSPINTAPVGGGVWRLKWNPVDGRSLLCVCMQGGARVLSLGDDSAEEIKLESSIFPQSSNPLTYGGDFNHDDPTIVATASFYDHELQFGYDLYLSEMIASLESDLRGDKPSDKASDPVATCNPAPPSHRPLKLPTKLLATLEPKSGAVRAARFNADGNYCLICTSTDRCIKLYSPLKNLLLKTYKGHNYDVLDFRCSFDNASICSASADKNVFVWDVATGNPTRKFKGHLATVNCVLFNEDASVVVSGSVDNAVKLWDNRSRNIAPIQTLEDAKDSVTCLDVSDHEVLVGSADSRLRLYDLRKGHMTTDYLGSPVSSARLSNDGQCVLVGTMGDQTVRLLDKHSGELLNEYKGHKNLSYKLESCFSPGDAQVISGSEDGRVIIWDLIDAKPLTTLIHPLAGRAVHSVAVHPEDYLVLSAQEGKAFLWGPEDYSDEG